MRKIVVDSCVDFNEELLSTQSDQMERVPFKITIDDVEFQDRGREVTDELKRRNYHTKTIKTACASPGEFLSAMGEADEVFVVTISSKLSGSCQAANSAAAMFQEEHPDKKVHVFDTKSASAGETLVAFKLQQLVAQDNTFEEIVSEIQEYIRSLRTLFALESLDTLVSNGRVGYGQQIASKVLKLFPIMGEDGEGNIIKKDMARGNKTIIPKLVGTIEGTPDYANQPLGITHVNAPERAEAVKKAVLEKHPFQNVYIFEAGGLSSVYASNGGIVIAY